MIVELFGPPGAGKTTFARAIGEGLLVRGLAAQVLVSARPSEVATVTDGGLLRAAVAARGAAADPGLDAVNDILIRLLPPHSPLWRLRLRRYLRILATSWRRGGESAGIVVFDQGYTQALCSLISLTRDPPAAAVAAALALLPQPAVRIALRAPREILLARVGNRRRTMSLRERILELDAATNLAQAGICEDLLQALTGRGLLLSSDPHDRELGPHLDAIAAAALRRNGTGLMTAPGWRMDFDAASLRTASRHSL